MKLLSLLGFGAFVFASLIVGLRLLLLARHTREVPELAIGTALLVGGGIGYVLIMLVMGVPLLTGTAAAVGLFAGSACTAIGAASLAVGVRRIFRPGDSAAAALVAAIAIALAATLVGRLFDLRRIPAAPWIFWTATLVSALTYAWSAAESLHFYAAMRRRMRIGLTDAASARRFLLWGISACAAVGMHAASMLSRALVGAAPPPAWLMGTTSVLGIVAATGLWLAFFPRRQPAVDAEAAAGSPIRL